MRREATAKIAVVLAVRVLAPLSVLLVTGTASFAGTVSCNGAVCTHTRDVTIWFGTLTVVGAPGPNVDVVQLTDTIAFSVANGICGDPAQDARVCNGLGPWVDPLTADIDWVDSASQNLPAQQNLLDAFAAAAASLNATHGTGTLTMLSSPLNHGTFTYTIANWTTTAPPPDNFLDNIGNANVTAFEQNAIWTAPSRAAAPALTPFMTGVVALLLLMLGLRRMNRRHD